MSLSCHCFRLVFRVHFHLLSPSHSPSVTSLVLVVTYVVSDAALPPVLIPSMFYLSDICFFLIYPWIASSLSIFSSNSSLVWNHRLFVIVLLTFLCCSHFLYLNPVFFYLRFLSLHPRFLSSTRVFFQITFSFAYPRFLSLPLVSFSRLFTPTPVFFQVISFSLATIIFPLFQEQSTETFPTISPLPLKKIKETAKTFTRQDLKNKKKRHLFRSNTQNPPEFSGRWFRCCFTPRGVF